MGLWTRILERVRWERPVEAPPDPESRVEELDRAHDSGLVSDDDYESMKLQLDEIAEANRRNPEQR
jgi:hypothetical protein